MNIIYTYETVRFTAFTFNNTILAQMKIFSFYLNYFLNTDLIFIEKDFESSF